MDIDNMPKSLLRLYQRLGKTVRRLTYPVTCSGLDRLVALFIDRKYRIKNVYEFQDFYTFSFYPFRIQHQKWLLEKHYYYKDPYPPNAHLLYNNFYVPTKSKSHQVQSIDYNFRNLKYERHYQSSAPPGTQQPENKLPQLRRSRRRKNGSVHLGKFIY